MYKMDLAEGSLVLSGFLLLLTGMISKLAGINLLEPMIRTASTSFLAANTCFLMSMIVYLFGKKD